MAEGALSKRRRVFVEDARRNGLYVRATWHAEERQFVISTWDDEVCTGAVRVPVEAVPELTSLLIDGLAAAAATPPAAPPTEPVAPWWRRWFARGTDLAPVVALRRRTGGAGSARRSA